jgi:hypothetical protein
MNSDLTQRITAALSELHRLLPMMRFGQLVLTVAESARGPEADATYEVTDEEFLEAAQRLLERRRSESREAAAATQPVTKKAV